MPPPRRCAAADSGEVLTVDVEFTGGGAGSGMVYLAGKQSHERGNEGIIVHILEQVEMKAAQIEVSAAVK